MGRKSESLDANLTLIRFLIKEQNLTIKALAKKIDVSYEHLLQVLGGHRPLSITAGKKIAKALHVPYESLLTDNSRYFVERISDHLMDFVHNPNELTWKYAIQLMEKMGHLPVAVGHDMEPSEAEIEDQDLLEEGDEPDYFKDKA